MEERSEGIGMGIFFLLLSIAWMAVIFIFSAQTGDESGSQSGFLRDIICKLIPFELSQGQKDMLTFIIRKLAHFTEYGILGVLYFQTKLSFCRKNYIKASAQEEHTYMALKRKCYKIAAMTTALCMLYAASDEFHQSFSNGRTPSVRDVIIDTCGGFTGSMLVLFIVCSRKRRSEER